MQPIPKRPPSASEGAPQGAPALPSLREARYSQSLERGLAILTAFSPERPVLGIADLAAALGMSRSTTHRYVITLLALGYLEQGTSRKYRLGVRVAHLGLSALRSMPLQAHARPLLQELHERIPYTNALGVLDSGQVLLLERIPGRRSSRHAFERSLGAGARLPAHCTALGKLLLAHLPEQERREAVGALELVPADGPRAITSHDELSQELERIRERGVAVASEEIVARLQAIAAPVRDESGEVIAAVNIVAHGTDRQLAGLLQEPARELCQVAARISERLGYGHPEGSEH